VGSKDEGRRRLLGLRRSQPVTLAAPAGTRPLAQLEADWGNVQARVVEHLTRTAGRSLASANTASGERGVDIIVEKRKHRLYIEVKGLPSTMYAKGDRAGQTKPTNPNLQARHWFSHVFLQAAIHRTDHPSDRVAIALPDRPTYRSLSQRARVALKRLEVEVWFVSQDGRSRKRDSDDRAHPVRS
jgi:hypothetical protein